MDDKPEITKTVLYRAAVGTFKADFYVLKFLAFEEEAGRPPLLVLKKLSRALEEFGTYIDNNAGAIVNYGERHRCGERISTGFVDQSAHCEALREETANAMDASRCTLATSGAGACPE
jgi:hypothetical protein